MREAHASRVIRAASSFPDQAAQTYNTVFGRLGAPEDVVVNPPSRRSAATELVSAMDNATGVFMTGGNQRKLSQLFVGTLLVEAISRAHERGSVVAGASAGASILSRFMIWLGCRQGDPGSTPASSRPDWACCRASSSTSILMNARPQAVPEGLTASATETTQPLRHANHP